MLLEPRSPENLGNLQIHCVEGIHFKWGSRRDQGQNDRYMMSGNWWTLMRGLPLKNSFNAALLTLHMVQERQSFRSAAQILLWLMQGRNEVNDVRGKKQVWRPHVRIWGLLEANSLCLRKYSTCDTVGIFRRPRNCAPRPPSLRPWVDDTF